MARQIRSKRCTLHCTLLERILLARIMDLTVVTVNNVNFAVVLPLISDGWPSAFRSSLRHGF
uniref:Uncharacterized protein n=1 Tax=Rhizophora mucronata TaxID=61149 RepID=A0A2P2PTU9_RHIMU